MSADESMTEPMVGDVAYLPASVYFDDRGRLVVSRLGGVIRDAGHLRTGTDSKLWRFQRGVYRPDGDAFARAQVRVLLGEKFRRSYVDEVLVWLRSFLPTISDRPPLDVVNLANGLLEWRTGELHPHDPAVLSTMQLPVSWLPDAACNAIERFLDEVLPDPETVEFMYEAVGYTLYPGNPLRRALMLLGPGCNGKTVLLGLVRALLGEENVACVPLQVLSENRFASARLFNRLANIAGDLDARAVKTTDIIKMATGNDPLMAENKYGTPFEFINFATFWFSANEPPLTSDQSDAWFTRWIVVPFENVIPEDKLDPHLLAKLTTAPELSGFLVRAVAGMQRLFERGRFDVPKAIVAANEAYRDRLDSIRAFVADACVLQPKAWAPRPQLYRAYRTWAQESGRMAVSLANFQEHIARNYPALVLTTRTGSHGWSGIGLLEKQA